MHLKPELNGSTTWASHMKNMEEETWPGRSDTGLQPILQHQKMVIFCTPQKFFCIPNPNVYLVSLTLNHVLRQCVRKSKALVAFMLIEKRC